MGAKARAKEAGPGAISPTAAGSAGGEAEMKVDVAMPLAPHAGAVSKEKARAASDEGPSPRRGRSIATMSSTEGGQLLVTITLLEKNISSRETLQPE